MTFIKSIALAAATVAATASIASANNAFPFGETFEQTDLFELNFVRADAAGVVEIYDYHKGVRGALLGTEAVNAGVNTNVKINLGLGGNRDVLAVLNINGQDVLTKDYDVN